MLQDGREAADQPEIALPEDSQGCPLSQNSRKREGRGQEKAGFRLMGGGGQSQFGATVCLSCQMVTVVPPPPGTWCHHRRAWPGSEHTGSPQKKDKP